MKKSLIALAVLGAFAGVASAQSSVTIYGQLDISYGKVSGGAWGFNNGEGYGNTPASALTGAVRDGFNSTSLIGFKGSEDLGGGARANFELQTGGFDMSTGATGLNFSREAWAGLSGSFGAFRMGRTSSVATKIAAPFDLNGTSQSSALGGAGVSPVVWYGSSRRNAQFQYETPNMGGVVVRFGYTPKGDEGADPVAVPSNAQGRSTLGLSYGAGPLSLGFVTESAQNSTKRAATAFLGGFDFGVAKVTGGIVRSPQALPVGTNFNATAVTSGGKGQFIAVAAPFGQTTVGMQYARNTETEAKALELFANYALSKRTRLYVDHSRLSGQNAMAAVAATATAAGQAAVAGNPKQIAFGIVHTF